MIRQAISCDICGTDKRQTNNWFVAHNRGAELLLSGWNSPDRLSEDSKHLCGQTCLHKLVDEFMARAVAGNARQPSAIAEQMEVVDRVTLTDTSLTTAGDDLEFESSARLIPTPSPVMPVRVPVEPVTAPARPVLKDVLLAVDEAPRFTSRNWRAEAWERERERELHAVERRPDAAARHRSNA